MWEHIKKKIKYMFDEESKEIPSSKERSYSLGEQNTVQTRVTYQYPNDRNVEIPMKARAPKMEISRPQQSLQRRKRERLEEKSEQTSDQRERVPFKPTDVPSPVYGFKNRPSKESLDIPAFIRKENDINHKVEEQDLSFISKHEEVDYEENPPVSNYIDNEVETVDLHERNDPFVQEDSIDEEKYKPVIEPEINVTDNSIDVPEAKADQLNEPIIDSDPIVLKEQVRESRQTPFNVMMTPRDKKRHLTKSMTEEKVVKEDTITTTNKVHQGPPIHLLNDRVEKSTEDSTWVEEQIQLLQTTLKHFHVRAKVVNAMQGPAVTRFEIQPEPGVKVSKIKNLSDDIKLNLAARDIRMEAPIPGKNAIGIEVPNPKPQPVVLQELFETDSFKNDPSPLSVALGLDIAGRPIITDLKKMPHGLIAGATGSGKSVCINTILISMLYKANHEDVRFLLIDPKMVELAPYNELPHLVSPVITDVKAATSALKWAVNEMEDRYEKFVHEGVRDIDRYNNKIMSQNRTSEKLPYLVIIIDELADLMMASPQDVEDAICRIAQKARACGIHLLLATQRPSVDVITGLIKANIPTRIAFSVSSQVDSRTMLDNSGAEKLLGKGDMLFVENGAGKAVRIQGAFVSDEEISRVTAFIKKSSPPNYLFEQEQLLRQLNMDEEEDELYVEAVEFVVQNNGASTSLLQRRLKIGYNRAARLIDTMEMNGIISEQKGSKPRDVLISDQDLESLFSDKYLS
ncbi:DNA translocase FtsK [Aquibacillus koreensis]|uniref:DNA translocase FtsK n=1 Tax=Aquibacillus koreensis TaxID=279446 RepID=A0A9X4AIE6_9BACI|nr:DNA translocase FtsK [Aquibacillus koreensis]MCT2535018.1 DNA translocase FtsK [Aquibacillus koreensis]MDC3419305.1 DNA translocase FtsK [Aquibacillus koreensis]